MKFNLQNYRYTEKYRLKKHKVKNITNIIKSNEMLTLQLQLPEIINEIKIRLKHNLETILNSEQHNKQLAYLSHLFKLEDKSFNGIVAYLNKEINYIKPNSVIYESKYFQDNSLNSEMNKIAQRIKKFNINFKDESLNQDSKYKI